VLIFVTWQWVRIVPTRWDVFPNAISAGIQYASLHWPTEDGWSNYNALQLLTYFVTVFIAAPLAIFTGLRMVPGLAARWERFDRIYPVTAARKLHYPVFIYFIAFIVVHVTLVLATGALRNLNHMYGGSDRVNWVGFSFFAGSVVLMVGGWFAARPLLIASVARLSGRVGR
jgi:thiosulfate reductase cytochrome b subunit